MVFASLEFLTLFLPLFLVVYALTPQRARNFVLLVGSWIFYSWLKPIYLLLLVAVTVVAWAGGLMLEQLRAGHRRKVLLTLLLTANVAALCWYKYANILVTRADNKDAPGIKKLVNALHSPEVKKFILDKYKGAVVPAF